MEKKKTSFRYYRKGSHRYQRIMTFLAGMLLTFSLLGSSAVPVLADGVPSNTCIDDVHDWGEWEISQAATCTNPGIKIRYCKNNRDHNQTDIIPATGQHIAAEAVIENEVPATCTEAGSYDSVVYCSTCEAELSREKKTIEPTGDHTPAEEVRENEVPATCGKAGSYDSVVYCSTCEAELSREKKTIEPTGDHTPAEAVRENEVPATCAEAGSYDSVVYCSTCEAELSRKKKTIKATGQHTPGLPRRVAVKTPECAEDGYLEYVVTCQDCGAEVKRYRDTVPAYGHYPDFHSYKAADCIHAGNESYYECRICGAAGSSPQEMNSQVSDFILPATGVHVPGGVAFVTQPTCTTPGYTSWGESCIYCGEVLSKSEITTVKPAYGHSLFYVPSVEPDETGADGHSAYYMCRICGEMFRDADGTQPATKESVVIRAGNTGSLDTFSGKLMENNGTIQTNDGTIENSYGSIVDNTGIIENNYGTILVNTGTVQHHFYNLTTQMDAGSYSVGYDSSFRCVHTAQEGSHMFLEAGQSGIITLSAKFGSHITGVTYTLNGQELALEDLGDGRYRITAPDMPSGTDGFAFNEGNLHVEIAEDLQTADDNSWKTDQLRTLEAQGPSITLSRILDYDRNTNRHNRAIRIEGGEDGISEADRIKEIEGRSDVRNALAEIGLSNNTGTMVFVLENGGRVLCDMAAVRKIIIQLLPKISYRDGGLFESEESVDSILAGILSEAQWEWDPQTGQFKEIRQQLEESDKTITVVFKPEEDKPAFQPNTPEPELQREFYKPEEEDDDDEDDNSCVTGDTMILLADGSEKRADELEETDILMVWDFDNGCLAEAPVTFLHVVEQEAPVLCVRFSDGTHVDIVGEHVFFDLTDGQFVAINSTEQEENLQGHSFAKLENGQISVVKLESIRENGITESYYSPVSEVHFNCFANGMLNISGFMSGLYNVFDLKDNELKYDAAKKAAEMEAAGVFPYEVFANLFPKELYDRNHAEWLSVSVAKGLITVEELYDLFRFCVPFFVGIGETE